MSSLRPESRLSCLRGENLHTSCAVPACKDLYLTDKGPLLESELLPAGLESRPSRSWAPIDLSCPSSLPRQKAARLDPAPDLIRGDDKLAGWAPPRVQGPFLGP